MVVGYIVERRGKKVGKDGPNDYRLKSTQFVDHFKKSAVEFSDVY